MRESVFNKRLSEAYWWMEKGVGAQEVCETFFIKVNRSGKRIKVCAKIWWNRQKFDKSFSYLFSFQKTFSNWKKEKKNIWTNFKFFFITNYVTKKIFFRKSKKSVWSFLTFFSRKTYDNNFVYYTCSLQEPAL